MPFGAAHTYVAYTGEYPHPPSPPGLTYTVPSMNALIYSFQV